MGKVPLCKISHFYAAWLQDVKCKWLVCVMKQIFAVMGMYTSIFDRESDEDEDRVCVTCALCTACGISERIY